MAIQVRGSTQVLADSITLDNLVDASGGTVLGATGAGSYAELTAGQTRTVIGLATTDSVVFADLSLNGGGTELAVTNNATIGGTLGVTGTSTLGVVNASGALSLSASGTALSITNNASIGGTLGVTGTSTLGTVTTGALTASGQIQITVAGTGLDVTNDATIGGDLTVTGDLTVNGDTVTVSTSQIQLEDSILQMAKGNNTTDTVDIGFIGLYDTSGSQDLYGGLFRDATDGKWRLFKDTQENLSTASTVNTGATGYTVASLVADLEGDVTGTVSDISNHDLSGLGNVSADGSSAGQVLVWDQTNSNWEPGTFGSDDSTLTFSYDEAGDLQIDLDPGSTAGLEYVSNGTAMVKAKRESEYFTVSSSQETSDTITLSANVINIGDLEDMTEAYVNGLRYVHDDGATSYDFRVDATNKNEVDFDNGILTEGDTVLIVYWKSVS